MNHHRPKGTSIDWRVRRHRRRTYNEPSQAHELTFTCYRRYPFLQAERTCQWLADEINEARKSLEFAVWAYVIMPEHAHLLIYPRRAHYDVGTILKVIKQPVGVRAVEYLKEHAPNWLQRITVRRGARCERRFWQAGGGYDRNVSEMSTLLSMIDYIHQNPVRRGLVAHAVDWKWSSAGWFEGQEPNSLRPDPIELTLLPAG